MMKAKFDPQVHPRRSIRLKGYDYCQAGAYFVTIDAKDGECLFGDIVGVEMRLSRPGRIAQEEWGRLAQRFSWISIDPFVVMPNHMHGIITIHEDEGEAGEWARRRSLETEVPDSTRRARTDLDREGHTKEQFGKPVPGSLATMVRSYKSAVTLRINLARGTPGAVVWQRNYYEHVVRNEVDLKRIQDYILTNPEKWAEDRFYPARRRR